MYSLKKSDNCLIVEFEGDFGVETILRIVERDEASAATACHNEMWVIGGHTAFLRLSDLLTVVEGIRSSCSQVPCLSPHENCQKKMAFVVDRQGLTLSIFELLSDGISRAHPFSCRVFDSHETASEWLEIEGYGAGDGSEDDPVLEF
ncbi:MAG: hypothetical protein JXR40_14345 [Pontiellaceae bacterium]|nr:hypothetical protein [Pontiellaceae bacterium]